MCRCRCVGVQVSRYRCAGAGVQVCRRAGVQVYMCTGEQVCRCRNPPSSRRSCRSCRWWPWWRSTPPSTTGSVRSPWRCTHTLHQYTNTPLHHYTIDPPGDGEGPDGVGVAVAVAVVVVPAAVPRGPHEDAALPAPAPRHTLQSFIVHTSISRLTIIC